ncbi:hypothetical protein CDL15_Pgr020151 [Punica granatum]|uniref:Protein NRT1/ PTR FAMILY 4.5-like n=1 Tax=Punica granatum TaxID=22663 RepID=A0A218VQP7_PUNGR|nr:hypothetical protein CDL15_Pgr020151 [Punica granatum]
MEDEEAKKETPYAPLSITTETRRKGGFRASGFIFALTGLENMGFVANMVSLVLYFIYVMYFDSSSSSNTLTNLMGATFLLTLVGGFISDTYLSRLNTCLVFGCLEVIALAMVTIQARSKHLQPDFCGAGKSSCITGGKAVYFYVSLCLLALGVGGVKGALPALGADQFNAKDPVEAKALATFFNWLTLSTTVGAAIGVTAIVWVSMNRGWYWGFFISTVTAFIGFLVLAMGKPFYRIQPRGESPLIRIVQVMNLAIKNRKLTLPRSPDDLYENTDKAERIAHTGQFSFLDKAAIVPKDSKPEPWKVCPVTQVEEVKILMRMLPVLASTILLNTCMAQLQTFSVQQGRFMDPQLGRLNVPTPSIPVIPLLFMSILIPIYEFFFVPFARKITGHPSGITQLQRVGVGLVLAAVSMAIAGIVEVKRRENFHKGHKISLFWLSFQYGIFGIADMFSLVGLLHFFYKEAPVGMRSLSTSFTWLSLSFGYFLSSIFVDIINAVTKRVTHSKRGWLYGQDINSNNLNLFYWFLAILSVLNFGAYLCAASWYKYRKEEADPMTPKPLVSESDPKLSDVKPLIMNDSARKVASKTDDASPAPALADDAPKSEDKETEKMAVEEKAAA